jgi:hypothetical protein
MDKQEEAMNNWDDGYSGTQRMMTRTMRTVRRSQPVISISIKPHEKSGGRRKGPSKTLTLTVFTLTLPVFVNSIHSL